MAAIDIGAAAINRGSSASADNTYIGWDNPANDTGTIDTFEIWAASSLSGCKAGTFDHIVTTLFTSRDVATIGNVTSGSKQTFSGLSVDIVSGDYAGMFFSGGSIEKDTSGYAGLYYTSGDQFGTGTQNYTLLSGDAMSLYGTGETPPPAGWTGKIIGVTNPAKIMGVAVADISKVMGVS